MEINKNGSPSQMKPADLNDVEMIFGTPNSPKSNLKPDVHDITNERRAGREPTNTNNPGTTNDVSPLLEPDKERQKPPSVGPEIDDLNNEKPPVTTPYPGIDDGLLEDGDGDKKPDRHDNDTPSVGSTEHEVPNGAHPHEHGDDPGGVHDDGKWPWMSSDEADYPYGISNRFGPLDRPGSPFGPASIDVNTYQQKKNLAQGMMDLALLSANANQLRYVLESATSHPYYYSSVVFISFSILLQIAVGIGLIMNSRYDVNDKKEICKADKINNFTVLGIFLITIVNVFITSFSVASPNAVGTSIAGGTIMTGG